MCERFPFKRKANLACWPSKLSRRSYASSIGHAESIQLWHPQLLAIEHSPYPLSPVLKRSVSRLHNNEFEQCPHSIVETTPVYILPTKCVTFTKTRHVELTPKPRKPKDQEKLVTWRTTGGVTFPLRSFDRNENAGIQCALFDSGQCNFSCRYPSHMTVHNATHSDDRPFECDLCPAAYKQKTDLTLHRRVRHENDASAGRSSSDREHPLQLQCCNWDDNCSWSFSCSSTKERHELVHSHEKLYECSQCDFKATYQSTLCTHVNTTHMTLERTTCPLCDRRMSPYSLYDHLRRHDQWDSFNCNSCDFETHVQEDWLTHLTSDEHLQNYTPSNFRPSSIARREDYKSEIQLEFNDKPLFTKCTRQNCPVCTRVMDKVSKISYGGYFFEITQKMTCQSTNVLYMWINKRNGHPIFRKHRYVGMTEQTLYRRIKQYNSGECGGRLIKELFNNYGEDLGLIPLLTKDNTYQDRDLEKAEINFIASFNCRRSTDGGCNILKGGKGYENMPMWLVNTLKHKGLIEEE